MEEMYDILTKCQVKIQCCKPDEVDDWQLEAYICRLKTRLLYSSYFKINDSIKPFKDLVFKVYGEVCDLHSMKKNHNGVVDFELRINKLTMMLKDLDALSKRITC
jgi:hypothetical protein